jgi:alkylation response protein AidB-like acyl-CoA dehydrogenase
MTTLEMPVGRPVNSGLGLSERVDRLAAEFRPGAAKHDAGDAFVAQNFERLRSEGLLEAGVPAELGGAGATVTELADLLRRLAHGCSSTALAYAMHTHQVAFPAWRWHNQPESRPKTEPLLRRIATDRIVVLTSGGGDWIGGSGRAEKVEGGYRITAHKRFVSGAPAGALLMTSAVSDEDGGTVVHFACPMTAPEVSILDTWQALGMRGTGSHDVRIDGFFLADDKVAVKRPAGRWHPVFHILGSIAFPLIYAVYLGVAERARDIAVDIARRGEGAPHNRSRAGEMDTALCAARLAHRHMVSVAEHDLPSAATINAVMTGRRLVEESALRTVERAMDLAGGTGFYRRAELERLFRDIQAVRYHPLHKEAQTAFAGAMALGEPTDTIF